MDAGAFEVLVKDLCFCDRGRLGEGDEQDLGLARVLEPHQRGRVGHRVAHVTHDVAVVGPGSVEEQEGVSGGGCVDNDELAPRLMHGLGELLEDRDLLGTRGEQVLGKVASAGLVEALAFGGHHPVAVFPSRLGWVDA